jgi:hypothetical protein
MLEEGSPKREVRTDGQSGGGLERFETGVLVCEFSLDGPLQCVSGVLGEG